MCGCLLHAPYWRPGPQPRHVPWLGIKPVTLWFTGQHSIHWATPARAQRDFFIYFDQWLYMQLGCIKNIIVMIPKITRLIIILPHHLTITRIRLAFKKHLMRCDKLMADGWVVNQGHSPLSYRPYCLEKSFSSVKMERLACHLLLHKNILQIKEIYCNCKALWE